jgi:uncharacterized protein
MPEEIARGRSVEGIRQEYSRAWGCLPEELNVEVLEKPGLFSRQWKVRVSWTAKDLANQVDEHSTPLSETTLAQACHAQWNEEENKYIIKLADSIKIVEPFAVAGAVFWNGEVQESAFRVSPGDIIEFYPAANPGQLTWEFDIRDHGSLAVAKVRHEKSGHFTLPEVISSDVTLRIQKIAVWEEDPPSGQYWDEEKFESDLGRVGIIYGVYPTSWKIILAVDGFEEVIIGEGTPPIPPVPPKIEDFVGSVQQQDLEEGRIDFFASKIQFVKEEEVLARKIPGEPGIPGKDVFGQDIPAPPTKDISFKLKKNVRLSEDGLEIIATAAGLPLRSSDNAYMVENVYILNQDVDLATGSIEFPGDVFVSGNVQDGLHIYSGGKVEIRGSISKAEIRAEKGLVINHNVLAGKLIIGEKFVTRSELLRKLHELHEYLTSCLMQTIELINSPNAQHLKPGQGLKLMLERKFSELPKLAADTEKFVLGTKDEFITQDLIVAVRTAKQFITGLGPLEPQAMPLLERVNKTIEQIILNISLEVPEKLNCSVEYLQGATVECGGSFECRKGTYNSNIRADGDLKIEGVCRGGKIVSSGNVEIKELGGSGVSTTTVQFPGSKRLKVGFCHPNVMIIVDKEVIRIEEPYRSLEVYRESGRVQIEKLRGNR